MAYVDSSSYSYGTSAFSSSTFGSAVLPTEATPSSSASASCIRIVSSGSLVSSNATVASIGGFTANADATVSASSTSSCGATRVREGDANPSATATGSASSTATFVASGLSSVTASTASVAEQFVLKESDKFSYGSGAYGYNVYDSADLQTIVSATSVASTATGERVQSGSATVTASASTASDSTRVRESDGQSDAVLSATGRGVFITNGSGSLSASVTTTAACIRKRNATAIKSVTSGFAAIGREKWEPIGTDTQSWSTIPETSITWSDIAA